MKLFDVFCPHGAFPSRWKEQASMTAMVSSDAAAVAAAR
jgi:hypothetical protein